MTISKIHICSTSVPTINSGVTFLYVTNPERPGENKHFSYANPGFASKVCLEVNTIPLAYDFLHHFLPNLDFNMKQTALAVYSDASCIDALDIALMISKILPDVAIETDFGMHISDFRLNAARPVVKPKDLLYG